MFFLTNKLQKILSVNISEGFDLCIIYPPPISVMEEKVHVNLSSSIQWDCLGSESLSNFFKVI